MWDKKEILQVGKSCVFYFYYLWNDNIARYINLNKVRKYIPTNQDIGIQSKELIAKWKTVAAKAAKAETNTFTATTKNMTKVQSNTIQIKQSNGSSKKNIKLEIVQLRDSNQSSTNNDNQDKDKDNDNYDDITNGLINFITQQPISLQAYSASTWNNFPVLQNNQYHTGRERQVSTIF